MASPQFNRERAARILVDAIALGDKTACKQWKINERTLVRYRSRLSSDPQLSELVRAKGRVADEHWSKARVRFLRKAISKLEQLIDSADQDQIRDVSEAVKVVGELQVASAVLHEPGTDFEGARSAEDAARAGAGGDRPSVH